MPDLFVDTSGWGHLVDPTQSYHMLAAQVYRAARRQQRKIVTTNYIITELAALLASPLDIPRPKIIAFIEGLKTSPYVQVVHVDSTLDEQAWEMFKNRQDKEWSLVDCASFVLMQQHNIREALATDHHFEQAGFVCLLKSELLSQ
ncbi:MAG TPA: PIN domain-containing protein [Anaerolineae bacterium]|nr:PIN domain-containing protein [Anaerolineae bacterium]